MWKKTGNKQKEAGVGPLKMDKGKKGKKSKKKDINGRKRKRARCLMAKNVYLIMIYFVNLRSTVTNEASATAKSHQRNAFGLLPQSLWWLGRLSKQNYFYTRIKPRQPLQQKLILEVMTLNLLCSIQNYSLPCTLYHTCA